MSSKHSPPAPAHPRGSGDPCEPHPNARGLTHLFYVYRLASGRNGTLHVGHTDAMLERLRQHHEGTFGGFTARRGVRTLVGWEQHETREEAFLRERQIKKWNRFWKVELIEKENRRWRDLQSEL